MPFQAGSDGGGRSQACEVLSKVVRRCGAGVRPTAEVARHALRIGSCCLDDESWAALDGIMPLFFRNSAFNMAESLLMPDGDVDFVALGVAKALFAKLSPSNTPSPRV